MPDAATIAVLRDTVLLTFIAIAFGVVAYNEVRRMHPLLNWNCRGNVLSRLFGLPDALFILVLTAPYLLGLLLADPVETAKHAGSASHQEMNVGSVLSQIVLVLGQAIVALIYLRVVRGFDVAELFGVRAIRFGKVVSIALGAIAPTFLVVIAVNFVVSQLLTGVWPDASPQSIVKAFETTGSIPVRLLMVFAAVVAAPITEELIFRGLVYGVCKRYTDGWFAAIASSLLFASVHLHVGSFVPLFALAMILAVVYELTGCILVSMLMHALFNSIMLISMALGAE